MKEIKIKINDIYRVALVLNDLISVNDQPHVGQMKRILYKLEPEIKFIGRVEKEDIEAVKDQEITLGKPMDCPPYFLEQHREILEMLCKNIPEKESQIKNLIQ